LVLRGVEVVPVGFEVVPVEPELPPLPERCAGRLEVRTAITTRESEKRDRDMMSSGKAGPLNRPD
jgi:hypothetical protein